MSIKILAAGDLHLGRQSASISEGNGCATQLVWKRIVDYAINSAVEIIILPGDVIDQENKYFEAIGTLQEGFQKLHNAEITVFLTAGNHDYDVLPLATKTAAYPNVNFIGANGEWEVKEHVCKNGTTIQLVGWSFPSQHIAINPLHSFPMSKIDSNRIAIGLFHGDVDVLTSRYAPVSLQDFPSIVDVWAVGHIHKPQLLKERQPTVFYTGSPQALSAKEQGKHGPLLLTLHSKNNIERKRILLSPTRYETISIDVSNCNSLEEVSTHVVTTIGDKANELEAELDRVNYFVCDIDIIGEYASIDELMNLYDEISTYQSTISLTEFLIRKVSIKCKAKVNNIEELATKNNPIGVVAKTILTIEKGEKSDFTDRLYKQWFNKKREIDNSRTYQKLKTFSRLGKEEEQQQQADEYILTECHRILSDLINQQNHG